MSETIPSYLYQDKYWKPVLHLFLKHQKLNQVFTTRYFKFEAGEIKIAALKRISAQWSRSEKFMLNLALHLYNDRNKVNLSDMDCLDDYNKELAFEAMKMRFR